MSSFNPAATTTGSSTYPGYVQLGNIDFDDIAPPKKTSENKDSPENVSGSTQMEGTAQKLQGMQTSEKPLFVFLHNIGYPSTEKELLTEIETFVDNVFPTPKKITDIHRKTESLEGKFFYKNGEVNVVLTRIWKGQGASCGIDMKGTAEISMKKDAGLEGRIKAIILKPNYTVMSGTYPVVDKNIKVTYV